MAGEVGPVRKRGLLDSKNYAGSFRILFSRDARTNLDALTPALDGDDFRTGLDNFVAEKHQTFLEL